MRWLYAFVGAVCCVAGMLMAFNGAKEAVLWEICGAVWLVGSNTTRD